MRLKAIQVQNYMRKHQFGSVCMMCLADLLWWRDYLPTWNGITKLLEPSWMAADDLELYIDASGAWGFGGFFGGA